MMLRRLAQCFERALGVAAALLGGCNHAVLL
jgi:hypothetical protein